MNHVGEWNKEERTFVDIVLLSKLFMDRLKDADILRGTREGMSDHYLVEVKVKVKHLVLDRKERGKGE